MIKKYHFPIININDDPYMDIDAEMRRVRQHHSGDACIMDIDAMYLNIEKPLDFEDEYDDNNKDNEIPF